MEYEARVIELEKKVAVLEYRVQEQQEAMKNFSRLAGEFEAIFCLNSARPTAQEMYNTVKSLSSMIPY